MIKATITPSISCAVVKLNEDASLSIYTGHGGDGAGLGDGAGADCRQGARPSS